MTLELDQVGIGSDPGAALPLLSAIAAPGRPGVVAVETEQAPVLASLVAGGRMRPEHGRVLLDGHEDTAAVRRRFALVDTPGVAEPWPVTSVRRVIREELVYADRRPSRDAVATVLESLGLEALADTHVQHVPTDQRIRLLVELALLRDGVDGLVVTSPERHGGAVADWFAVVREVSRRGITVLLVTSKAAAETVTELLTTDEDQADQPDQTDEDQTDEDQADQPDQTDEDQTDEDQADQPDQTDEDRADQPVDRTDPTDPTVDQAAPATDPTVPTGGDPRLQADPSTGDDADATTAPEARS